MIVKRCDIGLVWELYAPGNGLLPIFRALRMAWPNLEGFSSTSCVQRSLVIKI